jgi:hypothetical protein
MIGQTISRHRIVENLGASMGMLYEAKDVKLGRFAVSCPT